MHLLLPFAIIHQANIFPAILQSRSMDDQHSLLFYNPVVICKWSHEARVLPVPPDRRHRVTMGHTGKPYRLPVLFLDVSSPVDDSGRNWAMGFWKKLKWVTGVRPTLHHLYCCIFEQKLTYCHFALTYKIIILEI